jgi:DNA-binding transcriptional MerR regulator
MDERIPDKLYFKIGEVSELTGIKPHVLRYWESEFSGFKPQKSRSKQRLYRQKDVELVFRLKDLLHNQGFTIAGARKKLREPAETNDDQLALPLSSVAEKKLIQEIRTDLLRLRKTLEKPSGP